MRQKRISLVVFLWVAALAGCTGNQSALNPAGDQARNIGGLWWLFFWVLAAIYLIVIALLLVVTFRKTSDQTVPILTPDPKTEKRLSRIVSSAVAITVLILFIFLICDFSTGRAMHASPDPQPLQIKIIGHQWWWEVKYQDPTPSQIVTDANEIHLPVGKTVQFELESPDVIHSFWAPNFHGKKDLIPGHPTISHFRAERPGTFHGQCAEFCGAQHAHMRFTVIAQSQADFQSWLESARKSAPEPATDAQKKGQAVFLNSTCILCHTISGTPARGTIGPNLTHIASRSTLAADSVPNGRGQLAGWIVDPHGIKPGVRMPQNPLDPASLQALLEYLESLK
jgi:cytochrome c oxidase subunit 2